MKKLLSELKLVYNRFSLRTSGNTNRHSRRLASKHVIETEVFEQHRQFGLHLACFTTDYILTFIQHYLVHDYRQPNLIWFFVCSSTLGLFVCYDKMDFHFADKDVSDFYYCSIIFYFRLAKRNCAKSGYYLMLPAGVPWQHLQHQHPSSARLCGRWRSTSILSRHQQSSWPRFCVGGQRKNNSTLWVDEPLEYYGDRYTYRSDAHLRWWTGKIRDSIIGERN